MNPDIMKKLAAVIAAAPMVTKDQEAKIKDNFSYNYADINSILAMLKPILAEHGLAVTQPIRTVDGQLVVTNVLIDTETGESVDFGGAGAPVKGDPQAAGSLFTYYRRYGIVSLFGLEQADDDGAQARRDHDHKATGQARTEAEAECVRIIKALGTREERDAIKADFRAEFGCGLSELPEGRHGDALGYVKWWTSATPEQRAGDADRDHLDSDPEVKQG